MTKAILFDVDGVFLDESRCFDVSVLTVYELLYSSDYLGLKSHIDLAQLTDAQITDIRATLFKNDVILNRLKSMGINSNWDMLFVVFSVHFIECLKQLSLDERLNYLNVSQFNEETLRKVGQQVSKMNIKHEQPLQFIENAPEGRSQIYQSLQSYAMTELEVEEAKLFDISSPLWQLSQEIYQEWYLGTALYEEVEKKKAKTDYKRGYIYHEIALAPINEIKQLLDDLKAAGYRLAIATGRPRTETIVPFETLDLLSHFDDAYIVSASEVLEVESRYPELKPLGKPNPFSYIAAFNGNEKQDYYAYATNQENRMENETVTIVGDSLADLFSAQTVNAQFIGTLTGLKGKAAEKELRDHGAEILVDNVLDIREILL
ncbi:HAD family hydrolase [Staphylococcus intermedius]|uniref:Haloacid dehalogenase-like family hydrolase n=1 Tax=Staphylococcus intermedius NCTC 11048 TaxID=1141106 RepID=A0A380G8Y5_STAIN|nr:HAD hydrolase-like protein [Staphylococcus intermedius]PCF64651.1 HAD family hydrolase [Staphylococcus intermedius]PCF80261.1 HAD family hydrolase [Staphylococcus intermedius]PCF81611.1 HAD family hydrolase [Staphylococcus intermedius]PCF87948.1 HAD family hydrolase [Staphylococcus intermedius]PCF88661.1 HAD family hydrolase [Staphylococcus intermedius]